MKIDPENSSRRQWAVSVGKGHLPSSAREGSLIQFGGAKTRTVLVFVVDKVEKNCENH